MRTGLLVGAVGILAVVALAGWVRKPTPEPAYANPAMTQTNGVTTANATPALYHEQQQQQSAAEPVDRSTAYLDSPTANPCAQPDQIDGPAPAFMNRYGVRTVRQRVVEPLPPEPRAT